MRPVENELADWANHLAVRGRRSFAPAGTLRRQGCSYRNHRPRQNNSMQFDQTVPVRVWATPIPPVAITTFSASPHACGPHSPKLLTIYPLDAVRVSHKFLGLADNARS